jgi:hypothetical protein
MVFQVGQRVRRKIEAYSWLNNEVYRKGYEFVIQRELNGLCLCETNQWHAFFDLELIEEPEIQWE